MMRARGAIDALIPRGGAGLINAVVDDGEHFDCGDSGQ